MATLRPAYATSDRKQLLQEIAAAESLSPRAVDRRIPVDFDTIIRKATRKDAWDRYASAQEFGDDLRRFLESKSIRAKPPTVRLIPFMPLGTSPNFFFRTAKTTMCGGAHLRGKHLPRNAGSQHEQHA
jgi:hypothetical protein